MRFDTGIGPIGHVDRGSHFCHFYKSAEDLAETLVPYFKTGLENNESCIWVTAKPFPKERALAALNTHISQLDRRIEIGQLSVFSHLEWYERRRGASRTEVANAWIRAKDEAVEKGYGGLRLTGNTAFLEHQDWNDFMEYESVLRNAFSNQQIVALCSYDCERCDADAVLDVVSAHDFALARRRGNWEIVESAAVKRSKQALVVLNADLERLINERTRKLADALAHQQMLTAEVSHRVKNTVVTLQAIVDQTLRGQSTLEEARTVVRGRIAALARAHDQLARNEWNGVSLREAMSVLAAPYQGRVQLAFADVLLSSRATLVFSLLFHELATNAAKYGSLSGDTGCAVVTVELEGDPADTLAIRWCEHGGPRVNPPRRTSFGMKLMKQLVTHDLRGRFELRFDPAGVECLLQVPVAEVLAKAPSCAHHGAH